MEKKVILVDYEMQEKILREIESLKLLLAETKSKEIVDGIQWLDSKDLMEYLHICRRTALSLRKKGLASSQVSGKILYRKDRVDTFMSEYKSDTEQFLCSKKMSSYFVQN